eukprot:GHRR01013813.1.p1 GENE.GHRR01013813.1~~GHRR01013813.1.p1  ORF type:complete len:230 (-),score=59.63 GHRR01013813.1:168-857(-)
MLRVSYQDEGKCRAPYLPSLCTNIVLAAKKKSTHCLPATTWEHGTAQIVYLLMQPKTHLHWVAQAACLRNDLITKVIGIWHVLLQQLFQYTGSHYVDPHGGNVGLLRGTVRRQEQCICNGSSISRSVRHKPGPGNNRGAMRYIRTIIAQLRLLQAQAMSSAAVCSSKAGSVLITSCRPNLQIGCHAAGCWLPCCYLHKRCLNPKGVGSNHPTPTITKQAMQPCSSSHDH